MSIKRKGSNVEREILRKIWEFGFVALRVAGSGSSSFPACDLIAKIGKELFVIEVKYSSSEVVRIREEQLEELQELGKRFNAIPLIVVKFKGKGIYCTSNLRTKYQFGDGDLVPFLSFLESKRVKQLWKQ